MRLVKKIKTWLRLTRFEHAILSSLAVFVALIIAIRIEQITICDIGYEQSAQISQCIHIQHIVYALMVPILINLGAFALNDYFDIEADRKNDKKRPLVIKEIHPQHALLFGVVGLITGILVGFFINTNTGIVALVFAIFSFFYNYKLKDVAFIGNLFIALSMAISFLFAPLALGFEIFEIPTLFWALAIGATCAGLGREILKTIQDVQGDTQARISKTLPVLIGKRKSMIIGAFFFFVFALCIFWIIIADMQMQLNLLSVSLLIICALTYITFCYKIMIEKISENQIEQIRKLSLWILALALFAIFICII